jgi:hypothetical protein
MIATSRRSGSGLVISRQFEFSRFEQQTLTSAYEALIPVTSRRAEPGPRRLDECELLDSVHRSPRRSSAGV